MRGKFIEGMYKTIYNLQLRYVCTLYTVYVVYGIMLLLLSITIVSVLNTTYVYICILCVLMFFYCCVYYCFRRQFEYERNKSLLQHTITDGDELARRTLFIGRLDRLDKAVLGVYASICLFERMG